MSKINHYIHDKFEIFILFLYLITVLNDLTLSDK